MSLDAADRPVGTQIVLSHGSALRPGLTVVDIGVSAGREASCRSRRVASLASHASMQRTISCRCTD